MKNRPNKHLKALIVAFAALSYGAAYAQVSNTLSGTYVYPVSDANTNEPGFIWNISQVSAQVVSSLARAESQLDGELGLNTADPNATYSSAAGPATVPTDPNLPISFSIPGSIDFSIAGPGDTANSRPDLPGEDGMVGTDGGTVNYLAAEALTYLSLPQGVTTMGVRADDGFQLQIGAANPSDRYSTNAKVVESLIAGTRADYLVTLDVPEAGLYAARLLYEQGGGNASVEWYSFPPAGSTNSFLGELNTGTNAVLVGDVADGGIPAYQALTVPSSASYVSSFTPAPGSAGVSVLPTIAATIAYGSVPVTNITLTLDGAAVTPTITPTNNSAAISYTATNLLTVQPSHQIVLTWTDNGKALSVTSTFVAQTYVKLNPAQIVTPDTNKPGFKFNIFANSADPLIASANGVQGGDNQNLDNAELGLNGLEPDGNGGFLPNMITLSSNGAAMSAAPALGGPNAPAEFIITNTINLTSANIPGFPAQDGASDPSHSEILTYVDLPVGLTTFTLNVNGYYRAFVGSWDYTKGVQAGNVNVVNSGPTTFLVVATTAGVYPLRITVFDKLGTPQIALYTSGPGGTNALVNDTANGGAHAYYGLSTPSSPYVRYTSPRPVPRQVEYPNNRVLVRIQDGDVKLNDSTVLLNVDGKAVTVTNDRVGDVFETTWAPHKLQTPAEIHTALLTYQDMSGDSVSEQWTFLNLKAVWLSTAQAGYWLPTNAVVVEDFSEYADPTVFTNGPPTTTYVPPFSTTGTELLGAPAGNWYKSPQPGNPLSDVAPIWTNVPAGPTNWFVWNWDASQGSANDTSFDLTSGGSGAYANFLCVDLTTFANVESSSTDTAPGEMINGVPLPQLVYDPSKNVLMAESDNRTDSKIQGQTQFAMSKAFDLTGVTNPVLAFASLQKQNQDSLNGVEYSPDGGATWAPIIYYLDGQQQDDAGDLPDLQVAADNTVDITNTLFHDTQPGEIPNWFDSTGDLNNTYGGALGAPISPALAPFFAPRVNDDNFDGKRIEVVRMPLAANKSDVRLRLIQIGTCSWYFGIGTFAIYDVPLSGAIVPTGLEGGSTTPPTGAVLSVSAAGGNVTVTWTGSGTLQSASKLTGSPSDWSDVTPAPTGSSYTAPIGAGALYFRLIN